MEKFISLSCLVDTTLRKVYKFSNKQIDNDVIKDYIDSSVDNEIMIELIFKRGQQPSFEEVVSKMETTTSLVPNYTLISERGVKVLDRAEEIIEIFTAQRLVVVKRRYELLIEDAKESAQIRTMRLFAL